MTMVEIVVLALHVSMVLFVLSLGLTAAPRDMTHVLRQPGVLLRTLLAMNVIMPLFAVALVLVFELKPAVEIALLAMSLAPVPPVLPDKMIKAGGAPSYAVGMLVATALFAIVFVPLATELLAHLSSRPVEVTFATVARIVAMSMLLPLVAGVAVRHWAPGFATAAAKPVWIAAMLLTVAATPPVLVKLWPAIAALFGNFSVVAMIAFTLFGLAIGHFLGGPGADDRGVLALSSAARHPGVALAIAADMPDKPLILAAVLLTLLVGGVVVAPYVWWRRRVHASGAAVRG